MNRTRDRRQDPHEREGFTLVELLVVIAIIAIVAGLVVPSLMNAQSSAYEVQCMNNLRALQQTSYIYAQGRTKAYPIGKMKDPPAHESLNMLLKHAAGDSLEPEIFFCPEGEATLAESDESEDIEGPRFLLEDYNLSYTWVARRTKVTKRGPLTSDKYYAGYEDEDGPHEGHNGAMIIMDVSGKAVKADITPEGEFDQTKYKMTEEGIPAGLTR